MSMVLAVHIMLILLAVNSFNPISLAGYLLMSAIISGFLMGLLNSTWFFYFLALIFLGGVMVVVLFMCSICTNKKFLTQQKSVSVMTGLTILILSLYLFKSPVFLLNFSCNSMMISLFLKENSSLLIILFSSLLVCMLCVIFTSKLDSGPLIKNF